MSTHRSAFTKVAKTTDIPEGTMKVFKIRDQEVLVANVEGVFYSVDNRCAHRSGELSKGTLEGNIVTCPVHGSKFDVKTGKNVSGPKFLHFFSSKVEDLASYETKVEGDDVLVYQRSTWGM